MPDVFMPDVEVHIAFDSGYTTPAASRTWTDVSAHVELHDGIDIDHGRQDERSTADANSLSLTLDNTDGRFTAHRAASPYYPDVKIGRPVRVRARLNGVTAGTFGTFEGDVAGWSGANAAVARSTAQARTGVASLSATASTAANMAAQSGSTGDIAVDPSREYVAEAWVRTAVTSRLCDVRIDWYTAAGAAISTDAGVDVADSTSAWAQLTMTATSPANAAFARVRVLVFSPAAGEVHYVDDVSLRPTSGGERFVGFIDEWPVEWDGTDAYAKATIRATSRLARLGLSTKFLSMPEEAVLAARPLAYYTLGDPSTATTAGESSGHRAAGPLEPTPVAGGSQVPVVFGNAIGASTDGLSAMEFPVNGTPMVTALTPSTIRSLRACFIADAGADAHYLAEATRPDGLALRIGHNGSGGGSPYAVTAQGLSGGSAPAGALHDLVVTSSVADGMKLYLDGALVASGAGTDFTSMERFAIDVREATGSGINTRGAVFCHVAIYDVILTPTQIADQATAMLTGFEGDRTDERLSRILGWAGVPASEVTAETGSETMTYQQTSGQSIVDALRDVESTETGVLFDGRDGLVTFHNRAHRYSAPVAATFDMAAQHVGADYAPKLDRSTLANDATVDNPTTGETARSVDTTSVDEYGVASTSAKSVADSYDPLQQKAAWLVASYAEPRPRVPSLTVDVLAHVGLTPSAETILGLGVGDLVEVVNQPAQADATTADYFVEGYTETIGPESYFLTFNLSPAHPSLSTFVIEDATRGELDSSYVLAL
jgi:hypothetical protein